VKRDRNAVADDRNAADDLLDLADSVGRRGRLRLRILSGRRRSGQEIDDVGGKAAPFGATSAGCASLEK
jgi:hypothetical protein